MTTYTMVLIDRPATTAPARAALMTGQATTNHAGTVVEAPASQLYYWSRAWQANERIAAAELACGEGVEFDSTDEALRWLDSDD